VSTRCSGLEGGREGGIYGGSIACVESESVFVRVVVVVVVCENEKEEGKKEQ